MFSLDLVPMSPVRLCAALPNMDSPLFEDTVLVNTDSHSSKPPADPETAGKQPGSRQLMSKVVCSYAVCTRGCQEIYHTVAGSLSWVQDWQPEGWLLLPPTKEVGCAC